MNAYDHFNPQQIQFMSQDLTQVEIITNKKLPAISLIRRQIKETNSGERVVVPLWLALHLKKLQMCKIVIPSYLRLERLQASLKEEKENEQSLSTMPYYYLEVAYVLFKEAKDDFSSEEEYDKCMQVLEDIRYVRMEKLRGGLNVIDEESVTIGLTNIGATELSLVRGYLKTAFTSINTISNSVDLAEIFVDPHNMGNVHFPTQEMSSSQMIQPTSQ